MRQSGSFLQSGANDQVDSPAIESIANCLLYLFKDRKLQPSTIDCYCMSVIAGKLGNSPINVSKDKNLTRLLDSFRRDKLKGQRGIPF